MDGTILGQGTFVANALNLANPNPGNAEVGTANAAFIQIPSGADWVKVYNYTQWGTVGNSGAYFNGSADAYVGARFYWQLGMAAGTGMVEYLANTTSVVNADTLLTGGFTVYDPTGQTAGSNPVIGNPVAISAVTNATRPAITTSSNAGLSVGSVIRLSNTAQTDVNGIDMVVGALSSTTGITLLTSTNALATAPGAIGGAGYWRVVNSDSLFYPRHRYVTNVTQAANAQVSTSIAHGLTPGQAVRFQIPSVCGMTQLNDNPIAAAVVTVVDDYNFTINVNTTAYTAFTWPTIAQQPSTFPTVIPLGMNTAVALSSAASQIPSVGGVQIYNTQTGILADATVNTGYIGMILGIGGNGKALTTPIIGPAGSLSWSAGNVATGDTMYWVAGKSTYGGL